MNAVAKISLALGYDAEESMLAAGVSLASVYAFASVRAASWSIDADASPASTRALTVAPSTVRPGKKA